MISDPLRPGLDCHRPYGYALWHAKPGSEDFKESFKRNPFAGDLYIFRGRRGDLVKILWHDGKFVALSVDPPRRKSAWIAGRICLALSVTGGVLSISAAMQMAYMLEE